MKTNNLTIEEQAQLVKDATTSLVDKMINAAVSDLVALMPKSVRRRMLEGLRSMGDKS